MCHPSVTFPNLGSARKAGREGVPLLSLLMIGQRAIRQLNSTILRFCEGRAASARAEHFFESPWQIKSHSLVRANNYADARCERRLRPS